MIGQDGFAIFDRDPALERWAKASLGEISQILKDPETKSKNMRHGDTWFVGLDVLPNDHKGMVGGVPLVGRWRVHVPDLPLHRAQVSIVFPGYPRQDRDQSDANHRYRQYRRAAHVDGLLPVGPDRRRFAREFHAYILGVPLNDQPNAPTVVWRGSHAIMQDAIVTAIGDADPHSIDLTEVYHEARQRVFDTCEMVPLRICPGQAALIHRFALHGTECWGAETSSTEGRMIAFFRPEYPDPRDWLSLP